MGGGGLGWNINQSTPLAASEIPMDIRVRIGKDGETIIP